MLDHLKLSMQCSAFTERIPDNLLLEPIDYIFADHCRQTFMCQALQTVSKGGNSTPLSSKMIADVLEFLVNDLLLHIEDEQSNLYPCMLVRCTDEDGFSALLDLMMHEHESDRVAANQLRKELTQIAEGQSSLNIDAFKEACDSFIAILLSHLVWENAIILPLARERLTEHDLITISHAIATRRSIACPK